MVDSGQERYRERYRTGTTPWDTGRPDFNLVSLVESCAVRSCRALDVGCGSGHNSIWLAGHGFEVTGVDVSELALRKAEENASARGVACSFFRLDFLDTDIPGVPFGFAFDRGCFHSCDSDGERSRFAERVACHLADAGLWFAIVGSADEPPGSPGPPKRSARDVVVAVEPFFELLSISASHFESNRPNPPKAWACLLRKR